MHSSVESFSIKLFNIYVICTWMTFPIRKPYNSIIFVEWSSKGDYLIRKKIHMHRIKDFWLTVIFIRWDAIEHIFNFILGFTFIPRKDHHWYHFIRQHVREKFFIYFNVISVNSSFLLKKKMILFHSHSIQFHIYSDKLAFLSRIVNALEHFVEAHLLSCNKNTEKNEEDGKWKKIKELKNNHQLNIGLSND